MINWTDLTAALVYTLRTKLRGTPWEVRESDGITVFRDWGDRYYVYLDNLRDEGSRGTTKLFFDAGSLRFSASTLVDYWHGVINRFLKEKASSPVTEPEALPPEWGEVCF